MKVFIIAEKLADTARKRETRRRIGGTIVAERLKVWKEYNDSKEQASYPMKRKLPIY
ncbi:BnaC05g34680D [Brassica napus]|uniref:Uncharacterized protein n=2 Tax=Brassica TaxID=3705 RepID=A0A0D2ZVA5_BRAOL|nr:unnamed protein product [Brassica napus]CDY24486.1 BnaC05g34680D [Brassica napus]